MDVVLIIDRDYLLERTPINGNVDQDKLMPHMITAQDTHVQIVLGTKLYERILADIDAGTPLPEPYQLIMDKFIRPMLAHYTASDFYMFHAYEVANGGIFRHQSENSFTPDYAEIEKLHIEQRNKATFYRNRFTDYMARFQSRYPEYITDQEGGMYPDRSTPDNQWVL